jgi:ribosomal protein S6
MLISLRKGPAYAGRFAFLTEYARMSLMDEKDKKEYELAVLVKTEEDLAPVVALVRRHNGEMTAEPRAKKLGLAYEIKKNKEAVFAYMTFKAATQDAKTLEKDLVTAAEVIRSMIIASPAPAMTAAERQAMPMGRPERRPRTMRPSAPMTEPKSAPASPLSNEALEKKIEEILQ